MTYTKTYRFVLAIALGLAFGHPAAQSREMYRYITEDGVTVMDYQVPAEAIHRGYQVLSAEGVLLREVLPQLSQDERVKMNEDERVSQEREAEKMRLREWDESLLLRYSSVEDIEAAQQRALRNLEIRVDILNSNKRSLRQQVENYQSQAADLERTAQEVDATLLAAITDAQDEMVAIEKAIDDRLHEIEEVRQSFEADKQRFVTLVHVVEMRRTMVAKPKPEK